MPNLRPFHRVIAPLAALAIAAPVSAVGAAPVCTFLTPIGGSGSTPIVTKRVGSGKLLSKTNWNTDFIVDNPYTSFKFFFTANSSDPSAKYPVTGYIKFTDGSNLQLFNETISPPIGRGRMFGPFAKVPGKQAAQMNFKIGATSDPGALGFSYRISVQGCR